MCVRAGVIVSSEQRHVIVETAVDNARRCGLRADGATAGVIGLMQHAVHNKTQCTQK